LIKNTFGLWEDKMRKFAIIILLLFSPIYTFAGTHYVSKTGSDTYPYTSWATAADSIQKGINAASYGDTVRVGKGTYHEYRVTIGSGVTLIGAGIDSSIIDASFVHYDTLADIVDGEDSSSIEGFRIIGNRYSQGGFRLTGIMDHYGIPMKFIKGNRFSACEEGIFIRKCPRIINNLIDSCHVGISASTEQTSLIQNNTITQCGEGIEGAFSPKYPQILKNIIYNVGRAIYITLNDSLVMYNNLIYDVTDVNSIGIGDPTFTKKQTIRNNTLTGNRFYPILSDFADSDIRNNIIFGGSKGIAASGSGVELIIGYNDIWNNIKNYTAQDGAEIDSSLGGNIYLDPMFIGGDDYHLQYASPCIDAGDPNIKDPDSSRSDMGCYGGTYGETYTYLDYPPKPPDSLSAVSESTVTILSWKSNTESDLSHYLVYKDTTAGFIPDTFKIVGNIPKDSSVFRDYDFVLGKTYYYRVSAWDLTGHQSEYSDELEVKATSVDEYQEEENRPPMYQLSQNYPNPFNSETMIWYYLPDVGYQPAEVEITIYNLLGKRVKSLVNEREYPGEHKIRWDGKDDSGKEVASGIYFYRLKVSGIELIKPKKMVLLK
jgi:hypothetical protein